MRQGIIRFDQRRTHTARAICALRVFWRRRKDTVRRYQREFHEALVMIGSDWEAHAAQSTLTTSRIPSTFAREDVVAFAILRPSSPVTVEEVVCPQPLSATLGQQGQWSRFRGQLWGSTWGCGTAAGEPRAASSSRACYRLIESRKIASQVPGAGIHEHTRNTQGVGVTDVSSCAAPWTWYLRMTPAARTRLRYRVGSRRQTFPKNSR